MASQENTKEYEIAVQGAHNESQIVWQYSESYILVNTILIGFIAQHFKQQEFVTILFLSAIGLVFSLLWLGSAERRWGWYVFRMAQVRAKEKEIGFGLIGDNGGYKFSKGEEVIIDSKSYRLNWFARKIRTQTATRTFVGLFILIYIVLIVSYQQLFMLVMK